MLKNRNQRRNGLVNYLTRKGFVFGTLVLIFMTTMASIILIRVTEAEMGIVVASFNAPPGGARDLAWDGKYLYSSNVYGSSKIFKFDTNGNIIASFDTDYHALTLTHDGENLWCSAFMGREGTKIFKLDSSGNILAFFDAPKGGSCGLTHDGKNLWYSTSSKIYKLDTNGRIIASFKNIPTEGLAWDGKYLWYNAPSEKRIYKIDTNGNVMASIDAPDEHPLGLTYDGKYLWCSAGRSDHTYGLKIYKIDLCKATPLSKLSEEQPGFEAIFAIAGLLAAVYLLRRRK